MGTTPRIVGLKVENFQSLAKADIALGPFTVIVGPSNSGKSALLRALKAVVRNVGSPSAVRVGKTTFNATIEFDDGRGVSIERGKAQSTYRVYLPSGDEEVFTKAGRTVPDEVQRFLGLPLPEGPDLVFSSQIDPPFLLSETGTTAAKIIGDLTNVSRLHAAARESNRRRLDASKTQSMRAEDAVQYAQRLKEEFSDLPAQQKVLRECRELLDQVTDTARKRDAVEALLSDLEVAESAEADLRARLDELPVPADIDALAEEAGRLLGKRHILIDTLDSLAKAAQAEDHLVSVLSESEKAAAKAEKDYHDALVQEGTCPTCGQKVTA